MRNQLAPLATVSALVLIVALSACSAEPGPEPTAEASAPTLDSVSFTDGATLPPDADVSWGDGFANDDNWEEVTHLTEPGRWMYINTDRTCTAAFGGGALGDSAVMDDREASDAVITADVGDDLGDLDGLLTDGYFLKYGSEEAQIAHRQFSITIDGLGRFMAVRAFAALDYSVQVMVMCDGVDVNAAVLDVLSKNVISIEPESLG